MQRLKLWLCRQLYAQRRETDLMAQRQPHFVALGGTLRENSSTERALRAALALAANRGATTTLLTGAAIDLPPYQPEIEARSDAAVGLIDNLRRADAIIIGSPGYHGGISGLVKNALDYVEDMRRDDRCYFDGVPVGCVATAGGWQGAVAALVQLRSVVHALRGWPTPMGVAINTAGGDGDPVASDSAAQQLALMVDQQWRFLNGA